MSRQRTLPLPETGFKLAHAVDARADARAEKRAAEKQAAREAAFAARQVPLAAPRAVGAGGATALRRLEEILVEKGVEALTCYREGGVWTVRAIRQGEAVVGEAKSLSRAIGLALQRVVVEPWQVVG